MSSFSIRKTLAPVATALLLATPTTAAPSRLMSRGCLANIVADLSCADSSIMTRCIAIETVDVELLATCLEAAGCTTDEAENALWITEKCQTGPSSADNTQPDREGELRRRLLHGQNKRNMLKRADTTTTSTDESTTASTTATSTSSSETSSSTSSSASTSATSSTTGTSTSSSSTTSTSTTSSASATSTSSSSSSVNIGLSSAIVGTTLAIAAVAAFGGVFICAWREGAAKRKAKRESAQKEALLGNMS